MVTALHRDAHKRYDWADVSGRWFFAWRMATACEDALREVHLALDRPHDPEQTLALQKVSALLRKEMLRWMRRGEALDDIVDHLPQQANRSTAARLIR